MSKIRSFFRNYPHVKMNTDFYIAVRVIDLSSSAKKNSASMQLHLK